MYLKRQDINIQFGHNAIPAFCYTSATPMFSSTKRLKVKTFNKPKLITVETLRGTVFLDVYLVKCLKQKKHEA